LTDNAEDGRSIMSMLPDPPVGSVLRVPSRASVLAGIANA